MNKISCEICMDLIPLVSDGVASEDSVQAVMKHIEICESCRAVYTNGAPPKVNTEQAFLKLKQKIGVFQGMLLMFGIFYGLSLTAGSSLFYNIILMPVIGALGYGLFHWKAMYIIPFLLYLTHFITNYLGFGEQVLDFWTLVWWTFYYCLFAILGIVIAGLLHFALRKEK